MRESSSLGYVEERPVSGLETMLFSQYCTCLLVESYWFSQGVATAPDWCCIYVFVPKPVQLFTLAYLLPQILISLTLHANPKDNQNPHNNHRRRSPKHNPILRRPASHRGPSTPSSNSLRNTMAISRIAEQHSHT